MSSLSFSSTRTDQRTKLRQFALVDLRAYPTLVFIFTRVSATSEVKHEKTPYRLRQLLSSTAVVSAYAVGGVSHRPDAT